MPRALRHPNFALFVSGQIFALIGYWLQQIALAWLVYRMTGSTTLLGVLGFPAEVHVVGYGALPRTTSGKIRRRECAAWLEAKRAAT